MANFFHTHGNHMLTLQQRMALLRQRRPDLRQVDVARLTKLAPPSVHDWFNGKSKTMRAATATAVAALYGVEPHWLATGEGPMTAPTKPPAALLASVKEGEARQRHRAYLAEAEHLLPLASYHPSSKETVPVSAPYSETNLHHTIQLLGSQLGALDRRSRKTIGFLLCDLAKSPDEAIDVANKVVAVATTPTRITNSDELHQALRPRRRLIDTLPPPIKQREHT